MCGPASEPEGVLQQQFHARVTSCGDAMLAPAIAPDAGIRLSTNSIPQGWALAASAEEHEHHQQRFQATPHLYGSPGPGFGRRSSSRVKEGTPRIIDKGAPNPPDIPFEVGL